ncbi:MAG: lyase domain protein repeat-containing protein [Geminicoccaceae bacterium]|nr:lyase domain protein repeat-containing protein [Geminicoccaceae bacterium]
MRGFDLVLITAGVMLAAGLLAILAWFIYSSYLNRVERRLADRKGLYRELVEELATRDRALLSPTIHQMSTLYDLDALEAVLEEQARTATGQPGWLLEVYDQLGLVDKYIEKLRTARKWRDRAFAAELLGRVGNAKAVPALLETVKATQTEDADVREIALRALARIGDPQAVETLVTALASAEPWLAPRIADILARHGDVVVDPLIELLNTSRNHPARSWAANVLGEVRAQRAFPALVRGLDDPNDEVRAKSAAALGRLGDRRAVPPLLDHLLTDPAAFVRVRIASALSQLEGAEIVDRLVRALGDSAWWVRMRGVEALEQIGPAAEGPLLLALTDANPEIRQRAAVSLERLGVPEKLVERIETNDGPEEAFRILGRLASSGTRELLAELLHHPSSRIRTVVLDAITQAGRSDLTPELAQVVSRDRDPALRAQALATLSQLGAKTSLPVAVSATTDLVPQVRTAAIELLSQVGDRSAVELLRTQTGDPEPQVRAAAITALGAMGGNTAEPDFLRLLVDLAPSVRTAAVMAVSRAGLRSLAPALGARLTDEDDGVRDAAAESLGRLGDRSVLPLLSAAFAQAPPNMRASIMQAVGRLDPAAVSELLDQAIQNDDALSRLALAKTLSRLRWRGGWEPLRRLASDVDPEVRAAAIEGLGQSPRLEAPPPASLEEVIAEALRDSSETVRARAVEVCARRCLENEWRTLVSLLERDPSVTVRERAALAIGLLRVPGGETALVEACHRAEPPTARAAAALSAGAYDRNSLITLILEMPDELSIRDLLRQRMKTDPWFRLLSRKLPRTSGIELRALSAADPGKPQALLAGGVRSVLEANERIRLIAGLRTFQGEQSRAALLQLVRSDPSAEVRAAALATIAELLDPDELLVFGTRSFGDPNVLVRRAAVTLFARVPPSRAFPRLIQILREDDDPAVLSAVAGLTQADFEAFRHAALSAQLDSDRAALVARLGRYIHHPDLTTLLASLARHQEPEVRESVARVWQHRPDTADPLVLDALAADPVLPVRQAAVGAAVAAERYELLDRMTQDPEPGIRREIALALGLAAPVDPAGLVVLEHLESDSEMRVRAAAHVARLVQGRPVPLPPGLDPRVVADAVRDGADLGALRSIARAAPSDDRRLAAGLALAMIRDEVALEVARSDPAPSVRHRVSGALELSVQPKPEEPA